MEIKSIEKVKKYIDKLKDIDSKIISLEKLSKHYKDGCTIKINFGENQNIADSGLYTTGHTITLNYRGWNSDDDDYEKKEDKKPEEDLTYNEKLIDTESLFLLDSMMKIKKSQRHWLISELQKEGIKI